MARPSPSRRRCPLFLRLLVAAYWLAWSFRAPGQLYQLEALPAESPAPQAASSAPAASGSDAPAQNGATGATAAACDPCPPLSPSAVQPAAKAAGGASSDTQAPPEKKSDQPADADPPRLPRARWPTASEWLQLQAAESAARSKLPGNSFPDRPDWALRIGDPTPLPPFGLQASSPPAGATPQWDITFVAKPAVQADKPIDRPIDHAPAALPDGRAHPAPSLPAPLPSPPPAARAESAPSAAPGLSGPSIPPGTGTPSPLGEAAGFARGFAQGAGDELKDTATTLRRLPTVAYEVATDARYRQQVGKAVAARARAAAEFAKTALTHPDEAARRIASAAGQAWQSFLDDYQREGAAALGRALGHAVVFVATTIIPGGGEAAAAAKAVKAFEAIQAFEKAGDLENAVALLKAARAAGLEDKLAQEAKLAFIKAGCPRGYVDIFAIEFSKDYHWARPETLYRHSVEHEKDFGATGPASYARMAQEFLRRAQAEGLPTKIDSEGVIRIYDPATATFGVYNADGTTATFFKPYGGEPKKAQAYFDRQPGNSPNLLGGP